MKTLIFADVHLKGTPDGEETMKAFTGFLRSIDPREFDRIIILGDLFDFWFEYRHVIFSEYFEVLRAFAELRDVGLDIHLICGNHDFWAGRFLQNDLGMTIHLDSYSTEWNGRRILFVHGDGVNPSDRTYRIYKRFARFPLVVRLFRLLHPDWAMALARRVAHGSRTLFAPPDPSQSGEVHATERFARNVLERDEADVVVCGHSHYAVMKEWELPQGMKVYINTGDWMRHRCYVEWDGSHFIPRIYRAGDTASELQTEQTPRTRTVPEEVTAQKTSKSR